DNAQQVESVDLLRKILERLTLLESIAKVLTTTKGKRKNLSAWKHVTGKHIHNNLNLKIICHNIGLKENNNKLVVLENWAKEEELDVLGIAETNITSKECSFILGKFK
ncbi:33877_t:CDS:2, partial [Gigaspora margarita]